MNKLIITLSALAVSTFLSVSHAVNPITIPLWPDGAPTSNGISPDSEDSANPDWISNVSTPTLTIYPAENPNGTALVMCPGGAYAGLAAKHEGSDLAKDLNPAGITLAVLKYRMPNGHNEVPLDDARQALRLIRSRAAEFGINPAHVGIGGASAGGHLASTLATHAADSASIPNFQVLLYPVITMREGVTHQGSRENLLGQAPSEQMVKHFSNERQVTGSTPPAFIVVSTDDEVVPMQNSLDYFDALVKAGVPVSMHVYPVGNHGWAYRPEFPYQDQWVEELLRWMSLL